MKIVPYSSRENLEDLNTLHILIKAVPFENGFAPAMVIVSPDDNYSLNLDELHCLMDGIEIAESKISEIIDYIINTKTFNFHRNLQQEIYEDDEDDDEE
jgi:hypothetical protein